MEIPRSEGSRDLTVHDRLGTMDVGEWMCMAGNLGKRWIFNIAMRADIEADMGRFLASSLADGSEYRPWSSHET